MSLLIVTVGLVLGHVIGWLWRRHTIVKFFELTLGMLDLHLLVGDLHRNGDLHLMRGRARRQAFGMEGQPQDVQGLPEQMRRQRIKTVERQRQQQAVGCKR